MWECLKRWIASKVGGQEAKSPGSRAKGRLGSLDAEESLRQQVIHLLRTDPLSYLRSVPTVIDPLGPGEKLDVMEIDFYGVRIEIEGNPYLLNISKLDWMVGPNPSLDRISAGLKHIAKFTWVDETDQTEESWEEARHRVLPVVKGESNPHVVSIEWGCLAIHLVVDRPETMVYLQPYHLEAWGLTFEEVLTQALENLRNRSAGATVRKLPYHEAVGNNVWALDSDPDYSASMILLEHLIDQVPVDPREIYIMVPQRSRLYFVEKPDRAQDRINLLQNALRMWQEGGHPVCPVLLESSHRGPVPASLDDITCGDRRLQHEGGVFVADPRTGEPLLVVIPVR